MELFTDEEFGLVEDPKPKLTKRKPKIGRCIGCFYGYSFCKAKLPRKLKKKYYNTVLNHLKYMHLQFSDSRDYCAMSVSYKHMRGLINRYKFFEGYKDALELIRKAADDAGETIYIDDNGRLCWYWEDGEINGIEDNDESPKMPFVQDGRWKPLIDVDKGQVVDWAQGTTASIHYKVCDDGNYQLLDEGKFMVAELQYEYVPECLYGGDYIILEIDEEGFIEGWYASFPEFGQVVED